MNTHRVVVLCSGCTSNHNGRGVLDLHLMKQNVAVLGELNLPGSADQHLQGALRSCEFTRCRQH